MTYGTPTTCPKRPTPLAHGVRTRDAPPTEEAYAARMLALAEAEGRISLRRLPPASADKPSGAHKAARPQAAPKPRPPRDARPAGADRILLHLAAHGPATRRVLGDRLGLAGGYLARCIHALLAEGLVRETAPERGETGRRLHLAAAGRALQAKDQA